MIESIFSPQLIHALGWTLLHALWQGALFAIFLGILLIVFHRYSAQARYLIGIGLLITFFATTLLTFGRLYEKSNKEAVFTPANQSGYELSDTEANGHREIFDESHPLPARGWSLKEKLIAYYNRHLPLIITFWLLGILILQLRMLGQLAYLQRLKSYGSQAIPEAWKKRIQVLEQQLKINRRVQYLQSQRISSPLTFGWLKPVVLFPELLLAELKESEVYAIIAHELAHIKRHDFLVNCLQVFIGTLFFYHPGVWWMSSRIEEEREHSCDDLVVALTGTPIDYAKTLVHLQEKELAPTPLSVAYTGNNKPSGFRLRITRLISRTLHTGTFTEGMITAFILMVGMTVGLVAIAQTGQLDTTKSIISISIESTPGSEQAEEESASEEGEDEEKAKVTFNRPINQLLFAIAKGNMPKVKQLVATGMNLNAFSPNEFNRMSPLLMAAHEDRPKMAILLIKNGADPNQANSDGWTPLMEAADEGSYATAEMLIKYKAKVNIVTHTNGVTAAEIAAGEGHSSLLHLLLESGAKTDGKLTGRTPLHVAAAEERPAALAVLLNFGMDANVLDNEGRTALMYAAEEGKIATVSQLIARGANVALRDLHHRSAVMYAAGEGKLDVIQLLQRNGALIDEVDLERRTPLSFAAEEGKTATVVFLLNSGAKINLVDKFGRTALMYAAIEDQQTTVGQLLSRGADRNIKDLEGKTAMDYAQEEEHYNMMEFLIRFPG